MSLHELIYVSQAVHEPSQAELDTLLEKARERNQRFKITGLLAYKSGEFMQVLEGDEEHLSLIFSIIRDDPLHTDVKLLRFHNIAQRSFAAWSMGFRRFENPQSIPENYLEPGEMRNILSDWQKLDKPEIARQILLSFAKGI